MYVSASLVSSLIRSPHSRGGRFHSRSNHCFYSITLVITVLGNTSVSVCLLLSVGTWVGVHMSVCVTVEDSPMKLSISQNVCVSYRGNMM